MRDESVAAIWRAFGASEMTSVKMIPFEMKISTNCDYLIRMLLPSTPCRTERMQCCHVHRSIELQLLKFVPFTWSPLQPMCSTVSGVYNASAERVYSTQICAHILANEPTRLVLACSVLSALLCNAANCSLSMQSSSSSLSKYTLLATNFHCTHVLKLCHSNFLYFFAKQFFLSAAPFYFIHFSFE